MWVSCLQEESPRAKPLRWDWLSVFQEAGVGGEESRQDQRGDKVQNGRPMPFNFLENQVSEAQNVVVKNKMLSANIALY